MKTKRSILAITGALTVTLLILNSCSNTKRAAVPCPDFSRHRSYNSGHTQKNAGHKVLGESNNKHTDYLSDFTGFRSKPGSYQDSMVQPDRQSELEYLHSLTASIDRSAIPLMENALVTDRKNPGLNGQVKVFDAGLQILCDTIVLKPGNMIVGKVLEIGLNEIKYRECENLDGPVISILKSDVFVIKYPNGTRDYFNSEAPVSYSNTLNNSGTAKIKKSEGLGTAGFIAGLVGLFVAGILLGSFAVISGIISLSKINRHPEKYKGRGIAIASLVIGLIDVIGVLLLLSSM
jgi:hypothetical protein